MSLKSAKTKITRVRYSTGSKRKARTTNSSYSCDNRSRGDRSDCRRKEKDPAVDAIQDAGKELSCIFGLLKNKMVAEELAKAIRWREGRIVQEILKHCGCDCKVVAFFCTRDQDCVRICCEFGKWNEVSVTFDICIAKKKSHCGNRY